MGNSNSSIKQNAPTPTHEAQVVHIVQPVEVTFSPLPFVKDNTLVPLSIKCDSFIIETKKISWDVKIPKVRLKKFDYAPFSFDLNTSFIIYNANFYYKALSHIPVERFWPTATPESLKNIVAKKIARYEIQSGKPYSRRNKLPNDLISYLNDLIEQYSKGVKPYIYFPEFRDPNFRLPPPSPSTGTSPN